MIIEKSVLEYFTTFLEHKDTSPQVQNVELKNLIESYEQYNADTIEGKHGKTSHFHAMYIYFINLYHLFIKSIRKGDLDLYIYGLGKIIN